MRTGVVIQGSGVAACSCARLLQKQAIPVSFINSHASTGPTLLLNTASQNLLADVFELGEKFFSTFPVIRRRVVLWGTDHEVEMPHTGRVVNEAELLDKLWQRTNPLSPCESDWIIDSSSTIAKGIQQHFGSRIANTALVAIKETAAETCWVESLPSGWLFLLPCGDEQASLIAAGASPARLLAESRLVGRQVNSLLAMTGSFPCYPRILDPLCASGWLALGGGAIGFDPICGEGAGNAVREAILAAAVIQAAPAESLLSDYSVRLLLGFLRHLETCRRFYSSARSGEWWDAEIAALERGIEWTGQRLSSLPKPSYRMVDFRLELSPGV
jgi:flavin-dependent dehydrogenase